MAYRCSLETTPHAGGASGRGREDRDPPGIAGQYMPIRVIWVSRWADVAPT